MGKKYGEYAWFSLATLIRSSSVFTQNSLELKWVKSMSDGCEIISGRGYYIYPKVL
jgi:hypothetical protein